MSVESLSTERVSELGGKAKNVLGVIVKDRWAAAGLVVIVLFVTLGILGPALAPHDPIRDTLRGEDNQPLRTEAPSEEAFMGTTAFGKDVFSQFLAGARPTFLVGLFGGIGTGIVGFLVGLVSGYFGGRVDEVLMRLTDLTFALPLLPMALLVLTFVQPSTPIIVLVLVTFLWKMPARVIRSEVMSVKNRTFVRSARASGAGHLRTMFYHVAPNVLAVGFLYTAYAVSWSIAVEASLSFLGFGDPTTTSWGTMLQEVFESGDMRDAWWWVLPPAIGISAITTSVFLVGRSLEEIINPEIQTEGDQ
ncbi:ABC transporter permease [Halorussus salilacus]|uniref:ABC transporter permease n=1 Tax=Halorussus salilacus TaxID=2953750 RepID=UPI00209E61B9|nr:ABC transporter permease [Halorussus salilacus]USZ69606.1 ABC transporter permease [Halorussus salilacus]